MVNKIREILSSICAMLSLGSLLCDQKDQKSYEIMLIFQVISPVIIDKQMSRLLI